MLCSFVVLHAIIPSPQYENCQIDVGALKGTKEQSGTMHHSHPPSWWLQKIEDTP